MALFALLCSLFYFATICSGASTGSSESGGQHSNNTHASYHSDSTQGSGGRGSSDHSGEHASHHKWHVDVNEFYFIEMVILGVLLLGALCFELAYHHVLHAVKKSFRYDKTHKVEATPCCPCLPGSHHRRDGHGHEIKHHKLWKMLFLRAGGEFMILGFLAFMVWFANKLGFFEVLPHGDAEDEFHTPDSAISWLHMIEDVHMKLFFAMMVYFISASFALQGCIQRLVTLQRIQKVFHEGCQAQLSTEKLKLHAGIWSTISFASSASKLLPYGKPHDTETIVSEYNILRTFFIEEIILWKYSHKERFDAVVQALGITAQCDEEQVRECLDSKFYFSRYWALIIEESLIHMIQMPGLSMCFSVVEANIFAAVFYARCQVNWNYVLAFGHFSFNLVFTILLVATLRRKRSNIIRIQKERDGLENPDLNSELYRVESFILSARIGRRWKVETLMLLLWEVLRFSNMYLISHCLFHMLVHLTYQPAGEIVVLLIMFVINLIFLCQMVVIDMVVMFAFPPHVDGSNLAVLLQVLSDGHSYQEHHNPNSVHDGNHDGHGLRQVAAGVTMHPQRVDVSVCGSANSTTIQALASDLQAPPSDLPGTLHEQRAPSSNSS